MKVTDQLRSKFIKDNNLPIPLYSEPYFSYYLELYDGILNTKKKFENFTKSFEEIGSDQLFFSKSKDFSNSVIEKISETEVYKDFINGDMSKYVIKKPISSKVVYSNENLNQYLISIDMSSANFNALKYHNPEIVDEKNKQNLNFYFFVKGFGM